MEPKHILLISTTPAADGEGLDLAVPDDVSERVGWGECEETLARRRPLALVIAVAADGEPRSLAFLRDLPARRLNCPCLVIVPSHSSEELLRSAGGADDFVLLPVRPDELRSRLDRLLGRREDEVTAVKRKLAEEDCLRSFVTQDERMRRVLEDIRRMARANAPVLIIGETGTGKELCARALHHLSSRRNGPFIPVDCPALPDHLLENELFGHARGAYTDAHQEQKGLVALARGGTLFLDEVDSLSAVSQAKLLRFLQDRRYRPLGSDRFVDADVTLLAAANRDLRECVEQRQFREDLYYRLNVLNVVLPPLRDRPGDIELLAHHYLRELAQSGRPASLTPSAVERLRSHHWPGNVRELINTLMRAAVLADHGRILPVHLSLGPSSAVAPSMRAEAPPGASFRAARASALEAFERKYVAELLERHHGNVTHAAREAGKERRAFGRILRKYSISRFGG
jgi:two-component system response regulator GlrR